MNTQQLNDLSKEIVAAAIEVHRAMGPGLLESIYEHCMIEELTRRGIKCSSQVRIPLVYKGNEIEGHYTMDLLVEGEVILELKAVTEMHPVFEAQIISYLKLADKRLGFLFNFHVPLMKNGIRRFVNGF
jgi:GxxExxY protein